MTDRERVQRYETEFYVLDDLVTVEEAADTLGISAARVRQLIADNRFEKITQVGVRPLNLLSKDEVQKMAKVKKTEERARARAAKKG